MRKLHKLGIDHQVRLVLCLKAMEGPQHEEKVQFHGKIDQAEGDTDAEQGNLQVTVALLYRLERDPLVLARREHVVVAELFDHIVHEEEYHCEGHHVDNA